MEPPGNAALIAWIIEASCAGTTALSPCHHICASRYILLEALEDSSTQVPAQRQLAGWLAWRLRPRTVLTSWCTVAKDSSSIRPGTCTDPSSQTWPCSFRQQDLTTCRLVEVRSPRQEVIQAVHAASCKVAGWRTRSLRSRSTIMRFSARSFGDACRAAASCASVAGSAALGAVPCARQHGDQTAIAR